MSQQVDLIEVWPDTIDFPLHTKFIKENRHRFEKVIIVWMKTNWPFPIIREKVQEDLKHANITFVENDVVLGGEDWRSIAVNRALRESNAEWVWFTEQDFFPKEDFWSWVEVAFKEGITLGIHDHNRLHPCCLLIKRSILNRTSRDFAAKPDAGYDHFGKVSAELDQMDDVNIISPDPSDYYHMAGLTHNLFLLKSGKKPVYKPEEFEQYMNKVAEYEQKL